MDIFFKKNNSKSGFMMVEIIVAIFIIMITLFATMAAIQKGISISRQSIHSAQASFLLEEGAEAVRIARDNAWANISSLTPSTNYYPTFDGGTWVLSTTPNQVDAFTRVVTISAVNRDEITNDISDIGVDDVGTKLITITVSWQENGQNITKNLQFYISNIFNE